MRNKENEFLADITKTTKAILLKHEYEFVNLFGTVHHKLANNNTAAYTSLLQKVDTILS